MHTKLVFIRGHSHFYSNSFEFFLQAFVHLSTAFCHCEYEKLEEAVYPTPISPTDVIQTVQWMDDTALEMITPRFVVSL